MDGGKFTVLQIGYNADHNELYRHTENLNLSLAWMRSKRILAGSIGLNGICTLLSIAALIRVTCRRFELFSFMSLLLYSAISLAVCFLEVWCVVQMQKLPNSFSILAYINFIGGIIVLQILG